MIEAVAVKRSNLLFKLLVPIVALASVGLVWAIVEARRAPQADEAGPAEPAERDGGAREIQLASAEVRQAAGIETAPVETRTLQDTITCNAMAAFNQNTHVKAAPKAGGIVHEIFVNVGQKVHAGDLLAIINSQDVGELKASYIKALVHEEHLRYTIERYKSATDAVAKKMLVETEHLLEEQVVDTQRIKTRLSEYGLSPHQIENIAKNKDISIQLPVTAPHDGTLLERHAVEGELVEAHQPLFDSADLTTMWLYLKIYETQLPNVRLGQQVTFLPDGLPGQKFAGKVTWISPQLDPETRTVQVWAEVANPDGQLRANMFGTAELTVEERHERLVVPQAAVQWHRDGHVVFVQKPNNLFEMRPVVVGLKDGRFWEVTSGLEVGENVATTGSFLLKSNLENPEFGKVE